MCRAGDRGVSDSEEALAGGKGLWADFEDRPARAVRGEAGARPAANLRPGERRRPGAGRAHAVLAARPKDRDRGYGLYVRTAEAGSLAPRAVP